MGRSILQKLKPYYVRKALRYLRHYGPRDFLIRVRERLAPEKVPYGPWFEQHRASDGELERQRQESLAWLREKEQGHAASIDKSVLWEGMRQEQDSSPLFSVLVPAYRTPGPYLEALLDSVLNQTWQDLELVVANASPEDRSMRRVLAERAGQDPRLKVIELSENGGIAGNTNAAAQKACGRYVCFLDHDDLLSPDALYETALRIGPDTDLLYTDEDKVREDGRGGLEHFQPNLKPDFSLDLLRSNNYICHLLIVRRDLMQALGGISDRFEGAQDYEFILRCIDSILTKGMQADQTDPHEEEGAEEKLLKTAGSRIVHIPKILYHWRVHEASTADNPDSKAYAYEAGQRALEEHLKRWGAAGCAEQTRDHGFYRIRYELTGKPLVSIIIPNREMQPMLEKCLTAIRTHTDYDNYEVLVVENNSSSKEILDYYKHIQGKDHVRVIRWKPETPSFSFSAVNNFGVRHARGSYLVFLNNDVEVHDHWLSELLSVCMRPEVGAAGAKLFYPDGRVQSAGIVVGIGGTAASLFAGMDGTFSGYMHRASLLQDLSAVTAALMMIKRSAFEAAGGFDKQLPIAMNDVDLCLKVREQGLLVVFDPYAQATHHESLSRGDEYNKENAERYRREITLMKERWEKLYREGDPYYNPAFSLARWDYSLRV